MADQIVEPAGSHEPTEFAKTPKKAAASGWIGSALEYYDFFIYAQAAALVFPTHLLPAGQPADGYRHRVGHVWRRLRCAAHSVRSFSGIGATSTAGRTSSFCA